VMAFWKMVWQRRENGEYVRVAVNFDAVDYIEPAYEKPWHCLVNFPKEWLTVYGVVEDLQGVATGSNPAPRPEGV
jgi:hypothetical protein